MREEIGLTVTVGALWAIYDMTRPYVYQHYRLILGCMPLAGMFALNPKTIKAAYFAIITLSSLSEVHLTRNQLVQLITQDT
ncbi:NUDIX hydrolase [Lacticaseibacillus daqingensis]|uniref:hypothetical protein n=1 Tax=Lacticaseibacillus daqingensis TaxID=2486014 RepID=UPI0013DDC7B8|nr:hypothetical protein [Lacticaseibacillus daqingensis]